MVVMPSCKLILLNLVQPSKAYELMVVKVAGSSIDSSEEQPSKKLVGKVFCVTGRLMDLSDVQYWKAFWPKDLTEGGRTIVSSLLMFLHIYQGTACTPSAKVNEVICEFVL